MISVRSSFVLCSSTLPNGGCAGVAMQRTVGLAAEPTCQPSATAAHAQWVFFANLLEKIVRLRIVAVLSCPSQQASDFSSIAYVTSIEKRDSEMILSFLAGVGRRVVGADGPSVGPDGAGRIPASSDPVLKTVPDFKPGIAVMRASRTSPPLKGSPEVAQFSVRYGDVVRCGRVPEAKLVPQLAQRDSMPVQTTHELGCLPLFIQSCNLIRSGRAGGQRPGSGCPAHAGRRVARRTYTPRLRRSFERTQLSP